MLRRSIPTRTHTDQSGNYRAYRDPLKADFSNRCGYCDIHDEVLGVPFHIDHFAPLERFGELETDYSNLVYACPSCNRAKWNHWPMSTARPSHDNQRGFIDPCESEYDDHLERRTDGSIAGKTPLGAYISKRLKLQLRKHRFLWLLDRVMEQCEKVEVVLQSVDEDDPDIEELKKQHYELLRHYQAYHKIIRTKV
ncbi:HNH endonuclease signature motif containing protein [Kordiimonas pumila]|uniref:HNH endonuclease n=1 Tax=Kordiimonas pumila TaxID=2161677 RepID=A0ABV7D4I2_9PROT|nr:HNH endonuclease signature motif containing protein [Kordiimonas pumila]